MNPTPIKIECAHDEMVQIEKLIPHPRNPNKHPEKQIALLVKIIAAQGWRNPIVVSSRSGFITKGHARLEAAKILGCDAVPVDFQGYENEASEYADMIADNRIAELAEPSLPEIKDLLEELDTGAFDMDLTGFDTESIEKLMTQFHVPVDGLTDEDAIPENVETICQKGDLWKLGEHRLLCGDSTVLTDVEKLMQGEKADMAFTDPPYGVGFKYKTYDDVGGDAYKQFCIDWFNLLQSITARIAITPGCYPLGLWLSSLPEPRQIGVWIKTNALTHGSVVHYMAWEPILFYGDFKKKRANDVFNYPIGKQPDVEDHPCPKPIKLIEDIIDNFSGHKNLVLDLFGGSGSTLIACEKLGRKCRMMEIDEHYCDVIIRRWEDYTGKKAELL